MEDQNEIVKVEEGNIEVIYQQDKATIDMQIATAKAYPRNVKRSTENALAIVTLDKETASTCTYSVPRQGKAITGASVHLAKILAQTWGNMRIEAKVIATDLKHVTSQAVAFDLENNLAIKVEVKRSIVGKTGRFNDDMITVTGNAANAIALRNAILSVIPKGVVDKVYNAAKQTITGDVSDKNKLISRRKQVFDGLRDTYNLTDAEILVVVGKASIDHVTPDDLVVLIGVGQAIKDGDTTVEMAFKTDASKTAHKTPTAEDVKIKKERIKIMANIAACTTIEKLEELELMPDIEAYNVAAEIQAKKDLLKSGDTKNSNTELDLK
jgi:hypothetical protein